jgi:hypothetical protein
LPFGTQIVVTSVRDGAAATVEPGIAGVGRVESTNVRVNAGGVGTVDCGSGVVAAIASGAGERSAAIAPRTTNVTSRRTVSG